jgi:hypothetical protein
LEVLDSIGNTIKQSNFINIIFIIYSFIRVVLSIALCVNYRSSSP